MLSTQSPSITAALVPPLLSRLPPAAAVAALSGQLRKQAPAHDEGAGRRRAATDAEGRDLAQEEIAASRRRAVAEGLVAALGAHLLGSLAPELMAALQKCGVAGGDGGREAAEALEGERRDMLRQVRRQPPRDLRRDLLAISARPPPRSPCDLLASSAWAARDLAAISLPQGGVARPSTRAASRA